MGHPMALTYTLAKSPKATYVLRRVVYALDDPLVVTAATRGHCDRRVGEFVSVIREVPRTVVKYGVAIGNPYDQKNNSGCIS